MVVIATSVTLARCVTSVPAYVGSTCQVFAGIVVAVRLLRSTREDFACVCDLVLTESLASCVRRTRIRSYGFNRDRMCLNLVPPSSCLNGRIKDDFDAINRPNMDLCDCDENFTASSNCADCVSDKL